MGPRQRKPFSSCAYELNRMNGCNTNSRPRSIGLTYEREDSFVVEFKRKSTKCSRKEGNMISTNKDLQKAFLAFKKRRQEDALQQKLMKERALSERCDEARMLDLRKKFLDQAKEYFGVPYKKKYHEPESTSPFSYLLSTIVTLKVSDEASEKRTLEATLYQTLTPVHCVIQESCQDLITTMEFNSPIFMDCCGLVRRVLRDLKEDFGFTIGPWNQAYQFDTLPIVINEENDMKPGDLVFISGIYNDPKRKKQKHNMVHVEIWAGDGNKTIGARWQKGKVQVHDSYRFEAKSYHSMVYHFRSIDTWLRGICKSYCSEHPWKRSTFRPGKRSIFSLEKDGPEEDEDGEISQEDIIGTPLEGEDPEQIVIVENVRSTKGPVEASGKTQLEMVNICGSGAEDVCDTQTLMSGTVGDVINVIESEQVVSLPGDKDEKEGKQDWQHEKGTKEDGDSLFVRQEEFDENVESRYVLGERKLMSEEERRKEIGEVHCSEVRDIHFGEKLSWNLFSFDERDQNEDVDLEVEEELLMNLETVDDESWLYDSGLEVCSPCHPFIAWDVETEKPVVAAECSFSEPQSEKPLSGKPLSEKPLSEKGWQVSSFHHSPREMRKEFQGHTSKGTEELESAFASVLSLSDFSPSEECVANLNVAEYRPMLEQILTVDVTSMDELEETSLSDVEISNVGEDDVMSYTSKGWADDKGISSMLEGVLREHCGNRLDVSVVHTQGVLPLDLSSTSSPLKSHESSFHQASQVEETSPSDSDSPKDTAGQSSSGDSLTNQQGGAGSGAGQPANGKAGSNVKSNDDSGDGQEKRKSNLEGRKSVYKAENAPLFYIGGKNGVSLVEEPLLAKGWQRLEDGKSDKYKLRWVEIRSQIDYSTFRPGEQLINRIPGSGMLATKTGLFNTLRDHERFKERMKKGKIDKGMKMQDFFPESYVLDNKADRDAFFQIYKEGEIWICKPNNMNQGKGIYLVRDLEELKKKYAGEVTGGAVARSRVKRGTNQRLIQRYLPNPLLLNGKKFDVRTYMLIACTNPFVVLYHSGYCRLSCEDYDAESQDLARHLTNQYQQKKVATYQDVKNETVWSMERFNEYINTEIAEDKGLSADWVFGHFTKRMHQVMTHCFHAVKNKLDTSLGLFDLLGFDFIIDTDMKIWLLEVNVNPALHTNCDVLKEKLPPMIAETLDITLEIFEKSQKKQKILPLKSLKNFHLLYSATSGASRQVRPQRTKSTSPTRADRKPISPSRIKGSKSTVPPKRTSSTSKETAGVKGLTPKATPTVAGKEGTEEA